MSVYSSRGHIWMDLQDFISSYMLHAWATLIVTILWIQSNIVGTNIFLFEITYFFMPLMTDDLNNEIYMKKY